MKLISVLTHKRDRRDLLHHTAVVVVEDYTPADKEELVEQVSIKCGYHPLGYGIYGNTTVATTGRPNEYIVYWRTGTHCD